MDKLRAAHSGVGRISMVAVLTLLFMVGSAMAQGGPGGGGPGGGGGGGGGPVSSNPLVGQWTAFIPGTTLAFFYTFTADFQWKFSKRDLATGSFENVEGIYTLILPTADAPGKIVMDGTFGGAFFDDQVFIMPNGQIVFVDSLFGTINLMRH
jgi:hypothetical protein